ncbi:MAG: TIM-barrel domain-containing protein [Chloroflexia bacterium]
MGLLKLFWTGVRLAGLRNTLAAVRAAQIRDRMDRSIPRVSFEGTGTAPGSLQEVEVWPTGALFRFARAELEVHFLAPDLMRVTWQPGPLPVSYALHPAEWPSVKVGVEEAAEGWFLRTADLELQVSREGKLTFRTPDGHLLRAEEPPERLGAGWRHRALLRTEEHIYGLGERATGLNLRGGTYRVWNEDPQGGYEPGHDPLYLCIPVYVGLHREGCYLVFYENSFESRFRFDGVAEASFADGALRYYFIPGPLPRLLERYSALTGRPALPPRWVLGYHHSRWGFRTAAQIREVAEGFRLRALPLSAIHLDIDHMDGYRVFTVDRERFGDLPNLARELAGRGVRLVAIVDPGVKRDPRYAIFREGEERGYFCRSPDGRTILAPVWPGWCAFPDFTAPEVRAWWGEQYRRLLALGISGFWHDMNEPAAFMGWGERTLPLATRHAMEGRGGDHREAHNVYGLLHVRAGYEGLRRLEPERRPFIFSRSGWAGLQRYAWSWTGDTESSWEALHRTVATVVGLGLSGIVGTGPDIGGFAGAPDAELYVRWFQMAAFMPLFRTHSRLDAPPREPWTFGESALEIAREYLRLRYRLLPYLYSVLWQSARTGWPMVRPLFWLDPQDETLWDVDDAFLLGDALLVAPIVQQGAVRRQVRLPRGRWLDFWTDRVDEGGKAVEVEAPLARIPLFVRAGALLPMEEDGGLWLHLYALPGEEAQTALYMDAGDGYGDWRVDRFSLRWEGDRLDVVREEEGAFPFGYTSVHVVVHGCTCRRVLADGRELPAAGARLETGAFRLLQIWV